MLAVLLLPLLTVLLLLLADVALQTVTKLRLQVAVDHAALAAAESLKGTMNQLVAQNRAIREEFEGQAQAFAVKQQGSRAEGEKQLKVRQERIDAIRAAMDATVDGGYRAALDEAAVVVATEVPWATLVPLAGHADESLFAFDDAWDTLVFSYNEGAGVFFDPTKVETGSGPLLHHRLKPEGPGQQVAVGLRLRSAMPASFFPLFFDEEADDDTQRLQASAAAQPFGGSIQEGATYEATLVPLSLLQDTDDGYRGLYSFDSEGGWVEDDAYYLH